MRLFYLQVDLWEKNDDVKKAYKMGFIFTTKQLKSWGVKYHKLILGKPSFDLVIDDKMIFKKNLILLKKLD